MPDIQKHYLCELSHIRSKAGTGIKVNGIRYVLLEKAGEVFAYINECPHLKIPLDWDNDVFLDSDGDLIQCATHGALFTIENGECIYGPCLGQHLTSVNISISNEKIYLS